MRNGLLELSLASSNSAATAAWDFYTDPLRASRAEVNDTLKLFLRKQADSFMATDEARIEVRLRLLDIAERF